MLNFNKLKYHPQLLLRSFAILLVLLSVQTGFVSAGIPQVRVRLEPDSILIGQRAGFFIELDAPIHSTVHWPAFSDSLAQQIEVVSFGRIDTLSTDGQQYTLGQQLLITAWKPGFIAIAPAPFMLAGNGDTLLLESEPILLQVKAPELAENATPYDIKPILKVPITPAEVFPWLLASVLLALAGWLIWRYLNKRKAKPAAESIWEKPEIPAHIAAISSLESLKNKKLWQNGKVKLYHSELTFILRMYLEKRFGIIALEMTSAEIFQAVLAHLKEEEQIEWLRYILELADLVKFARYQPQPQQNEECMDLALEFVKRNIPPAPKEAGKGKTSGQE